MTTALGDLALSPTRTMSWSKVPHTVFQLGERTSPNKHTPPS